MKTIHVLSLTGAALFASSSAMAQLQLSPITVRVGYTHIYPHASATDAVGPLLPGPPSGVSLDVKDKGTLFVSFSKPLNDNMEVELALGYPPTHDVTAKLASSLPPNVLVHQGQVIAKVRQIAPTLFLNYKFGDADSRWRPFVGVGVNYTSFDKRQSTAEGNALNGGPTDIRLTDSWGLAGQVGLSYRIDDKWSINGSIASARVKSKLTATTSGAARTIDIRFHPVVYTVTAGYAF